MSTSPGRKDARPVRSHVPVLVLDDKVPGGWVNVWLTRDEDFVTLRYEWKRGRRFVRLDRHSRAYWESLSPEQRYYLMSDAIKRALGGQRAGASGKAASDADLASSCPTVHDFLTVTILPDGKARLPSSVLVFTEGELWKVCLNEREAGLSLWASGETLQAALACLEDRLSAPVVDWRKSASKRR